MTITTSYETNAIPQILHSNNSYHVRHGHLSLAEFENRLTNMKISEVVTLIGKIKGDLSEFEEIVFPKSIHVTAIEEDKQLLMLLTKRFEELQKTSKANSGNPFENIEGDLRIHGYM